MVYCNTKKSTIYALFTYVSYQLSYIDLCRGLLRRIKKKKCVFTNCMKHKVIF